MDDIIKSKESRSSKIQNHKDLYLNLRNFILSNKMRMSSDETITTFDKLLLKKLEVEYVQIDKYDELLLQKRHFVDEVLLEIKCFENADELLKNNQPLPLLESSTYNFANWNNFNLPESLIEAATARLRVGLNDTFAFNAMLTTDEPITKFLTNIVTYDEANITLYSRILGSLVLRTLCNNKYSNLEDFLESKEYVSIQFFLARFCIHNYVEWFTDYLKDSFNYNEKVEENIQKMIKSDNHRRLIHGFGNAEFKC